LSTIKKNSGQTKLFKKLKIFFIQFSSFNWTRNYSKNFYIRFVKQKVLQKGKKMTLKQYLVAGVIEQAIVLGFILPATGWWFSFFAISAVWSLVAGVFSK